MFTITKPPIVAGNGLIHYATSRQVSNDPSFTGVNLLINDIENEVDLLSVIIDLPLTVNDKYYVKDKLHFKDRSGNKKETNWSKPIIVTKNMDGFTVNNTIIGTPKLEVNFNKNDAPLGGFNITCDEYNLFKGVGTHKYSDWVIEDIVGNTVWKREKDGYNLTSIKIPDCTLERNRTYIIKVRYISTTNMNSNYGKLIICTNDYYMNNSCDSVEGDTISIGDNLEMLVATTIYNTL